MSGPLFIDCAPFNGGTQESFATLVEAFTDCAMAVGDGLAPRFPNATIIHARHWPANITGLFQFIADRRDASHILRTIPRGGGDAADSPSLIHANTLRSALLLTSLPISCPVIVHDRDIRAPRLAVRFIARRLRPIIIAISSTVAQKWRGLIPDENIHIIYNGFRLDDIRAAKPVQFPWNAPTIVLVADFVPWKRHRLFIDAFALAKQRIPNLHAIIRGRVRTAADEAYLNDIRDYVSDIPDISIDAAPGSALGHIAAADMLVSCSENEPFGRTVIEALSLSKPVIATPTAAPPELFKMLAPNLIMSDDSPQTLATTIADNLNKSFQPLSLDAFSVESMLAKVTAVHEWAIRHCQRESP
ncbi:MAG: glycosyltransferase family 4 protein [Victivallales bacterium]|nr:glycosyltransferase family 4 protein [Victivallales bacterium]